MTLETFINSQLPPRTSSKVKSVLFRETFGPWECKVSNVSKYGSIFAVFQWHHKHSRIELNFRGEQKFAQAIISKTLPLIEKLDVSQTVKYELFFTDFGQFRQTLNKFESICLDSNDPNKLILLTQEYPNLSAEKILLLSKTFWFSEKVIHDDKTPPSLIKNYWDDLRLDFIVDLLNRKYSKLESPNPILDSPDSAELLYKIAFSEKTFTALSSEDEISEINRLIDFVEQNKGSQQWVKKLTHNQLRLIQNIDLPDYLSKISPYDIGELIEWHEDHKDSFDENKFQERIVMEPNPVILNYPEVKTGESFLYFALSGHEDFDSSVMQYIKDNYGSPLQKVLPFNFYRRNGKHSRLYYNQSLVDIEIIAIRRLFLETDLEFAVKKYEEFIHDSRSLKSFIRYVLKISEYKDFPVNWIMTLEGMKYLDS